MNLKKKEQPPINASNQKKEDVALCGLDKINQLYTKKCGTDNKELLNSELENRKELNDSPEDNAFLYPTLDDPNFNIKIAQKKEFMDTKYDGDIHDVEEYAKVLKTMDYELLPQQAFVRNFLSFQTPYNSLLLFHGLGSGKTCSAIGVCEEMRDYLKQMGITKHIIIVASPNVQDNFKLQLFDERQLKEVDGIWTTKGCLGNKLLKEINPTGMKGLKRDKVIQHVKNLIKASYTFQGYVQFSNEIVNKSGKVSDSMETKIKNLEIEYANSLIVIDEVHNIRISDDNENKNVAKNLMFLVSVVSNLRLLLLSATPMFNSYEEIIWLLNLLNMNDRRGIISVSDVFDSNGNWKKDSKGKDIGKEMLIRKATGYISYVRGENPYTFPFRVYPDRFAIDNTFKTKREYPEYQITGRKITEKTKITKLSLYLTAIGSYQQLGYKYIIDRLRNREARIVTTKKGTQRRIPAFSELRTVGYTDLQIPIGALNIVYPYDGLENLVKRIKPMEYLDDLDEDEDSDLNDDISPSTGNVKGVVEEIDDVISNGPKIFEVIIEEPVKDPATELITELITERATEPKRIKDPVKHKSNTNKPACPEDKELNPNTKRCVNKCKDGYERDEEFHCKKSKTGKMRVQPEQSIQLTKKATKTCPEGKELNEKTNRCVNECKSGYERDDKFECKKKVINDVSFKGTIKGSVAHIIEGETKSDVLSEANSSEGEIIGGATSTSESSSSESSSSDSSSSSSSESSSSDSSSSDSSSKSSEPDNTALLIDPKDLTGSQGLKRIMDFTDSTTPAVKGQFEYKHNAPHVFAPDEIGKYSSKIKNICDSIYNRDTNNVSEGIILIYSSYIDAGIIPMALALEEMGFIPYGEKSKPLFKQSPTPVVDVRTMQPNTSKDKNFKPARYVMITGDRRISPNNDGAVKAITNNNNIFSEDENGIITDVSGEIIKVVLISQAGSEGLDFKAIRQVHILEPWYNVNRIEQIIGRAVRNNSHKDLPFAKRNVQIFLYGTILENSKEEAVDLYVYRMSEVKAVKIGKVTRLLKQTSVDCIINHDQTELIAKNFNKIEGNRDIVQVLSNKTVLNNFVIGDINDSATCDFMECEFKCLPDIQIDMPDENIATYNETFMLVNTDKIIQKIKALMKMRYFYKKNELFALINHPKKYPLSQIYAGLTQIINDNSEYIIDKYGRTGYLVNIGDYYLFQPSELNYKNISIFNRSVPVDYKHNVVNFKIANNIARQVVDKHGMDNPTHIDTAKIASGKLILDSMFEKYNLALETSKLSVKKDIDKLLRGNDNWYQLWGILIRQMVTEKNIIQVDTEQERLEMLESFLIEHIADTLMMLEKIDILNYIYSDKEMELKLTNERLRRFYIKMKKYMLTKLIVAKNITGIVLFNGPSRIENVNVFILNEDTWGPANPEDIRDLNKAITNKYKMKTNLNRYVGFIGFENNQKYMVFMVKDNNIARSNSGFRCDQAGKDKIADILNDIEITDKYSSTKDKAKMLSVRLELTLRSYQEQQIENKTWFLDTETAIINEFQKKEKPAK
jgi:superfamily II DNA or RNA helicase